MKKSSFQTNGARLFPFEFRISELSFSDSELKTESGKLSLKLPEKELGLSKDLTQARQKKRNRSGKPNTTFSWAPKRNILTWFDSPDAPLQKYTSTFFKLFFFAEKIDFYWAHLLNSQVLFQYLCEFCSECVENRRMEVKTDADTSEHFGEVRNEGGAGGGAGLIGF